MRAAAERRANVLGQRAYVRALAAARAQLEIGRSPRQQLELANLDLTWMARNLHTGARVLVIFASVALERRMARAHLGDAADKALQDGCLWFPATASSISFDRPRPDSIESS